MSRGFIYHGGNGKITPIENPPRPPEEPIPEKIKQYIKTDADRAKEKADSKKEAANQEARRKQLEQNKAAGKAFEQQGKKIIEAKGDKNATEQITIKTQKTGTRTRPDLLSKGSDGKIKITEFKSSQTAPLTKNQEKAFPELEQEGGVVVGKGKPPFVGGTEIPPTKVNVMRPEGVD